MTEANSESVRADQWLWAARFFKTRRLSREAIDGGKIEHNGGPCKPSRSIKVGDRLRVTRGEERFDVEVLGLSAVRGPARVAQTLYRETEESREAREEQRELRRFSRPVAPQGKPDKQARRQLRRIKEQG
ncbi:MULTISPECIES: RNA-binding S4 domain-containing protein [Oleiagrimonas]|uniref:Heat shock protein 15 n=1 Tax=Oleiagrimonas citrea TaxID=1665687 RepID=A0A846ZJL0_9GAMM|nr:MULTISPECIES: RNA-binding S4 domain-containing protein [Oleiagrimonas]NKZ37720.1 RNA-binding S4 domain-containing protein [Oleiagrimonas citrea]RAP56354.1 RNA-binding protein [Oleiagrimonas sp. MCCC 1A03011]